MRGWRHPSPSDVLWCRQPEPVTEGREEPGAGARGYSIRVRLVSREKVPASWQPYEQKPDATRASRQGPGFSPFRRMSCGDTFSSASTLLTPFPRTGGTPRMGRGQRSLYSSLGDLSIHAGHPRSVLEERFEVRRRAESLTRLGMRPSAPALRARSADVPIHAPQGALVRTRRV